MLQKILQTARILSLDVVLGAIISSMFIARLLFVCLPVTFLVALGIAVWLIYTVDHLADAKKIKQPARADRHRFHQQHFKPIAIVLLLVALLGLFILTLLPPKLIVWGTAMTGLVTIYFLLIRWLPRSRIIHKEFIITFLYTAGIFLAPVYLYDGPPAFFIILLFCQYSLLALINLLIFSWFESDADQHDGLSSYVVATGKNWGMHTIKICLLFFYMSLMFNFFIPVKHPGLISGQIVLLLMGATLHAITVRSAFFSRGGRYRRWADAVFWFPLFYLLIY